MCLRHSVGFGSYRLWKYHKKICEEYEQQIDMLLFVIRSLLEFFFKDDVGDDMYF